MRAWFVLVLVLLLSLSAVCDVSGASQRPIVIAHRGASGYLPEHTASSFAAAHAMGADFIEADLVLTRDGVPIALHDRELDTTTNVADVFPERAREDGRYYAIDFDWDEIRQLRAHERINVPTGEAVYPQRFPVDHARFGLVTLGELIELVEGLNHSSGRDVGLYLELKYYEYHREQGFDFPAILLDVLRQYGLQHSDNLYIQSFHSEPLQRLRFELGAELQLIQLIGANPWWHRDPDIRYRDMMRPEGLDAIAAYADGIGPWIAHLLGVDGRKSFTAVNRSLTSDAQERGLKVHAYTVRTDALPRYAADAGDLLTRLFVDEGVDGVFIDQPDVAAEFVRDAWMSTY